MKTTALTLFACLFLCCGCATHSMLTLNTGGQLTSQDLRKIEHGAYLFKDPAGQEQWVPMGRVHEVAPASMVAEPEKPRSTKPVQKKHWYYLWLA